MKKYNYLRQPKEHEIKLIYNTTMKVMEGIKVSNTNFDHMIETLDAVWPDMTFEDLKEWAYMYDISVL